MTARSHTEPSWVRKASASPRLLCFGSINIDITATAARLPRPGETVHADRHSIGLGGKGANQAAAAARLVGAIGGKVALAGRVGQDLFGAQARAALEAFGVDLAGLATDPEHPTGIALIGVDASGENAITVSGGCNMLLDETDLARIAPLLAEVSVVLLQLEIPLETTLSAARQAHTAGAFVLLDPAPVPPGGLPDEAWRLADMMTPNESETEALIGIKPRTPQEAAEAASLFQARGLDGVVIKLGARGVYFRRGTESGFIPPFPVKAIDSVAAGDCFNGGLAVALARGDETGDAVRFAAACGALATTRMGAAGAAPELAEVQALLS